MLPHDLIVALAKTPVLMGATSSSSVPIVLARLPKGGWHGDPRLGADSTPKRLSYGTINSIFAHYRYLWPDSMLNVCLHNTVVVKRKQKWLLKMTIFGFVSSLAFIFHNSSDENGMEKNPSQLNNTKVYHDPYNCSFELIR